MPPKRYRIANPTLAMTRVDGHHVAQTVPTGAMITVVDGKPFNGDRLMDIEWEGKVVMMFTHDLRMRTEEWKD